MKTNKLFTIMLLSVFSAVSAYGQNKDNLMESAVDNLSSWLSTMDTDEMISKIPENGQGNQMICIGSRRYLQFVDFMEAADTSRVLKMLMERYNLLTVNPDSIPDSMSDYYYFIKMAKAYPSFMVLDKEGNMKPGFDIGYNSEERLVALAILSNSIDTTFKAQDIYRLTEKKYNKYQRKKQTAMRYYNMIDAGHHVDVNAGYGLYVLSGNKETDCSSQLVTVDLGFRQDIGPKRRVSLGAGLALDHVFDEPAQTRLSIPIEAEILLVRMYPEIKCRAGVWGGRTFVKEAFRQDYAKYEAGVHTSLFLEFGNFDFSLGYKRGLTDRLTSPDLSGYSNFFTFSLRLRLFD